MKLKTPQMIIDNVKNAEVIELLNNIDVSRVILEFKDDPIQYGLEFTAITYSEWIEDNKLNRVVMDRPLLDDEQNPVDVIQYDVDAPIVDVMEENWCITECIKIGMPFLITEVWNTKIEDSVDQIKAAL